HAPIAAPAHRAVSTRFRERRRRAAAPRPRSPRHCIGVGYWVLGIRKSQLPNTQYPRGLPMPPHVLTDEQRLFFETNGYLILPNALPPEELARVRAAADRAEAAWRADPTRLGLRNANLEQVQAPIEYDDTLLNLLVHPVVFPMVWELLGDDV